MAKITIRIEDNTKEIIDAMSKKYGLSRTKLYQMCLSDKTLSQIAKELDKLYYKSYNDTWETLNKKHPTKIK